MKYQPHYQLTRTEVEEKKKPFAGRYECHICVATFTEMKCGKLMVHVSGLCTQV